MPVHQDHPEPADEAAAVCHRRAGRQVQFKLVRTKGGQHWTFPKGHIEKGETPWQAAAREAREEAGMRGRIEEEPLATYPYEKRARDGRVMELAVAAYLLHVESESDPPEPGREPTWFSPEQAKQRLAEGRPPRYQQAHAEVIEDACRRLGGNKAGKPPEEK